MKMKKENLYQGQHRFVLTYKKESYAVVSLGGLVYFLRLFFDFILKINLFILIIDKKKFVYFQIW